MAQLPVGVEWAPSGPGSDPRLCLAHPCYWSLSAPAGGEHSAFWAHAGCHPCPPRLTLLLSSLTWTDFFSSHVLPPSLALPPLCPLRFSMLHALGPPPFSLSHSHTHKHTQSHWLSRSCRPGSQPPKLAPGRCLGSDATSPRPAAGLPPALPEASGPLPTWWCAH